MSGGEGGRQSRPHVCDLCVAVHNDVGLVNGCVVLPKKPPAHSTATHPRHGELEATLLAGEALGETRALQAAMGWRRKEAGVAPRNRFDEGAGYWTFPTQGRWAGWPCGKGAARRLPRAGEGDASLLRRSRSTVAQGGNRLPRMDAMRAPL